MVMCGTFQPDRRLAAEDVAHDAVRLRALEAVGVVLDAVPVPTVIVNDCRQIVLANDAFVKLLEGDSKWMGRRPGEALGCVNATRGPHGCGSSEFCSVCGAASALQNSVGGNKAVEECRITLASGDALDLVVSSTPVTLGGVGYRCLSVVDNSAEKRRRVLERLFLHDALNSVSGLQGLALTLIDGCNDDAWLLEVAQTMEHIASTLVDDIRGQRELAEAEAHELRPRADAVDSLALLEDVRASCTHPSSRKTVVLKPGAVALTFLCDHRLLRRVLVNMVKNALEASRQGRQVTLDCQEVNGGVRFSVHNEGAMPGNIPLHIFRRSFSTKGDGRGLGTYSIKLFGEHYLEGKVDFTTDANAGTTFTVWLPLHPSYF